MTALTLPTIDEEIWRYSRINELDLARYRDGEAVTTVSGADGIQKGAPGVAMTTDPDVFATINGESPQVTAFNTPIGGAHPSMVTVTHRIAESGIIARPRLVIDAAENSEIVVVERFVSDDDIDSLVLPVLEVRAAQAARVTYLVVNELGRKMWQIGHQMAVGERDSTVRLFTVALGGDYARMRAEVRLVGQGASAEQTALYFADGTQMHDFRTLQVHEAPRTHSDLLFKGAVKDTAKSVYTGLIRIAENAGKSEAFQTNRNLTLSSGAWAESVPNLEIETNDVKCSHASTVGPIDDDQRFYLESRGVPPEVAERLVVFGFFEDVIARLPESALLADVRRGVIEKLGVRS